MYGTTLAPPKSLTPKGEILGTKLLGKIKLTSPIFYKLDFSPFPLYQ